MGTLFGEGACGLQERVFSLAGPTPIHCSTVRVRNGYALPREEFPSERQRADTLREGHTERSR